MVGNHYDLMRPSQGQGFLKPHIFFFSNFFWFFGWKVISKAVFLWESSKFLLVIICHMTRFSEIWSACFRLGAHQHKWSGRGNSFKCQKSAKKAKIFRCLANHLRALVYVTQSCSHAKLFQSNIGKIAAGYFYFLIDWSIHQFTTLSLYSIVAAAIKKFLSIRSTSLLPPASIPPPTTSSSSSWSFRLSFVWFFQLERFFFGPQSLFPRIPACNLSL